MTSTLLQTRVNKFFNDLDFLEGKTFFIPKRFNPKIPETKIERIQYWFDEKTIDELGIILARINSEKDESIQLFFKCCFRSHPKTFRLK